MKSGRMVLIFFRGLITVYVCSYVKAGLIITLNSDRFSLYADRNKTQIRTYILQAFVENQTLYSYNESLHYVCPNLQTCDGQFNDAHARFDYNAFRETCCPHCECSDNCFTTGTCCHDKFHQGKKYTEFTNRDIGFNSLDSNLKQCHYAYSGGGESTLNSIMLFADIKSYLIIKSCSKNASGNGDIQRCIYPRSDHLEDLTPVYSNQTHLNYANIFCAACNFVTEGITRWNSYLKCSMETLNNDMRIINDYEINFTTIKIPKSCFMSWLPPNENYTRCIKYSKIISTCSPECSSAKLDFLCDHIYAPVFYRNEIFQNVFCLVCYYCGMKQASCTEPDGKLATSNIGKPGDYIFTMLIDHVFSVDGSRKLPFKAKYSPFCGSGFVYVIYLVCINKYLILTL